MSNTIFHGEGIALSSTASGGAIFSFKGGAGSSKEESVTTIQVETKDKVSGSIVGWGGTSNDYPQKILAEARKNGSVSANMRFLRKAHYGNGLTLLRHGVTEDGKHDPKVISINDPSVAAVKQFFKTSQIPRFFKETIADLEWWNIAFPEYILSNDYTKINRVKRHPAAWCRFEVMNPSTGYVENVYISEKFGNQSVTLDSEFVSKVPLIDSYWSADEVREYCKKKKIHKFIRPVFYPLINEPYYPIAEWHSVAQSGWLEVANAVPAFKMNLFRNQLSIKFHIEVDERYFETRYKEDWTKYTLIERQAERQKLVDAINEHLSKPDNAGKSIQTMMLVDRDGKQYSTVKITAIDDKFKDGAYLPEAEAANSEISYAMGVDPSLIGAGIPGGKLGAGSGSDKNAAFNIVNALMKTNRETTLEVPEFIQDYNSWPEDMSFGIENTLLTTLDKNPTGSQKVTT